MKNASSRRGVLPVPEPGPVCRRRLARSRLPLSPAFPDIPGGPRTAPRTRSSRGLCRRRPCGVPMIRWGVAGCGASPQRRARRRRVLRSRMAAPADRSRGDAWFRSLPPGRAHRQLPRLPRTRWPAHPQPLKPEFRPLPTSQPIGRRPWTSLRGALPWWRAPGLGGSN